MAFAESGFAQFISSGAGRVLRIIAGVALIGWGFSRRHETIGIVLMVIGVAPLAAGLFDLCLLSPLFGGPLSGRAIRSCRRAAPRP